MAFNPFGALLGIADRVQGRAVEIDAAGEKPLVTADDALELCSRGRWMDAADQQPFALAGFEQRHGGIEPGVASRQHYDGVGLGRVAGSKVADVIGEPAKSAQKGSCEQAE